MSEARTNWEKKAKDMLVGRKIVHVEWMSEDSTEQCGFHSRPLLMELDNGLFIYPMADDEGNDGGALGTSDEECPTLPVF